MLLQASPVCNLSKTFDQVKTSSATPIKEIEWKSYFPQVFVLALVYFLLGKISLSISQENLIVTIVIFTSEGFTLAALLILGRRFWPGILLGQLALALSTGIPFIPALTIGFINSGEALLGATLFHVFKLNKSLAHIRDVFGLLAIIALILQPISALLGNITLLSSSIISLQEFSGSTFSWWFGNVMGQFLLTPMILLSYANWKQIKQRELLLSSLLFALLSYTIFFAFPIRNLALALSTTMPLIIIISAYRSVTYAMIITTVNAGIALCATCLGIGPFSTGIIFNDLINLNFYILSHILLLLTIGTLFSQKKETEEKLRAMALYDPLTGLPNRNLLNERMNHAIAMAHRFKIKSGICFIDIDGFKNVNDLFGHNAGDAVIKTVTQRINSFLGEEDSLIRLGGDEFLLIAMDMQTRKRLNEALDQISISIKAPIKIDENTVNVSLSIGVSICKDDSESTSLLIKQADTAMYQAKKRGKDQYIYHKDLSTIEPLSILQAI